MPGHKGSGDPETYDITEIPGADDLSDPSGIIAESERNAGMIFGARTFYSCEGSSLCVRAMLYLVMLTAKESGRRPFVISPRNAHKSFLTACGLLDIDVGWIYPSRTDREWYLSGGFGTEDVRAALESNPGCTAVYITSPDYLGNMADIPSIAALCREHGALLAVDNAHGAYLRFFGKHPISLGADMCCDSAHKTLPVLTGGAYLHISGSAPGILKRSARQALGMFSTTSPSYLILQSLDAANRIMSSAGFSERIRKMAESVSEAREGLRALGLVPERTGMEEYLKLTLRPKSFGYTGTELSEVLRKQGIVCEFSDPDCCVMMFSPSNSLTDPGRLLKAVRHTGSRKPVSGAPCGFSVPRRTMSLHDAMTSPFETLPADNNIIGRIMAFPSLSCPPAVSVAVPGETVDEFVLSCMKYYSIKKSDVITKI